MTVLIRAHHLLCILTYLGKGYTPSFVSNYGEVIARINSGEDLRLVDGPDDICQPMLQEPDCHCHNDSVRQRDTQAQTAIRRLLGTMSSEGTMNLDAESVRTLRKAFAAQTVRQACGGCEWQELCTRIAQNGFKGCHLAPLD